MYFPESVRLAERHPALADTIQKVDGQLGKMGTAEVIRPAEFASFLGADQHQVCSVLDLLAQAGILKTDEMIECEYCGMPVLRSDYDAALEEEDEYRCTSCDRPWEHGLGQAIMTYGRGPKWKDRPRARREPGGTEVYRDGPAPTVSSEGILHPEGWYTPDQLAEHFGVGKEALRKRLERYREHHLDCWQENKNPHPRDSIYLYRLRDVRHIIDRLRASGQRPAN